MFYLQHFKEDSLGNTSVNLLACAVVMRTSRCYDGFYHTQQTLNMRWVSNMVCARFYRTQHTFKHMLCWFYHTQYTANICCVGGHTCFGGFTTHNTFSIYVVCRSLIDHRIKPCEQYPSILTRCVGRMSIRCWTTLRTIHYQCHLVVKLTDR